MEELQHPLPQKYIKIYKNRIFALYGSWEALIGCKILPRGVGTISTPGKPFPDTFKNLENLDLYFLYFGNRGRSQNPTFILDFWKSALPKMFIWTIGRY